MPESDGVVKATGSARAFGVTLCIWGYAVALVLVVRQGAHHAFEGWPARLATMAGVAVGLWP